MTLVIAILAFVLSSVGLILTLQRNKKLAVFLENSSGKDIHKLLNDHFKRQKELKQLADQLQSQQETVKHLQQKSLQKIGLVRYNPHRNTGGDQSFSLCVLDNNNSGIILTAIHGRETTRVYSKTITERSSSHQLSHEESAALKSALNS